MKKEIHFRIVELKTHQVMLMKAFDDKEKQETIVLTFFHDGVKIKFTFFYDSEGDRNKQFDNFKEETCQKIINQCTTV